MGFRFRVRRREGRTLVDALSIGFTSRLFEGEKKIRGGIRCMSWGSIDEPVIDT